MLMVFTDWDGGGGRGRWVGAADIRERQDVKHRCICTRIFAAWLKLCVEAGTVTQARKHTSEGVCVSFHFGSQRLGSRSPVNPRLSQ